jgi:phosphopantetheinyl transferase
VVALWEITESEQQLQAIGSLPNNERQEMTFITSEQRRKERMVVHLLINRLLNKKIYIGYHDNGRPYLQNERGDISIAHTKRFVCILYHPTEPVGIDIECTRRDFAATERKALSDAERSYLGVKERSLQLCLLWCAKEAIYKRLGESGLDFSEQIAVEKFTPRPQGKLTAHVVNNDGDSLTFKLHYRMIDDHAMVWVVKS